MTRHARPASAASHRIPSCSVRPATSMARGLRSGAGGSIDVDNPATGEILGTVPRLGAPRRARRSTPPRARFRPGARRPAKERAAVLRRWFELMMANQEDLAQLMTAEQGKPLAESRGEVAYAASFLEWFGEEAKRVYGDTIPGAPARQAHRRHQGADRRRRLHHAVELSDRDDHAQGRAGARRRLHRRAEAGVADAVLGAGARRARRARRRPEGRASTSSPDRPPRSAAS